MVVHCKVVIGTVMLLGHNETLRGMISQCCQLLSLKPRILLIHARELFFTQTLVLAVYHAPKIYFLKRLKNQLEDTKETTR